MVAERIGRVVLEALRDGAGFLVLLRQAFGRISALGRWPVRQVLYKQIYFTGIEALGPLSIIAVLAGIAITTQIVSLAGADKTLVSRIMLWTIVRELGPLLAAIVVIARSSSATASELAGMSIRGELDSLRRLGIPPLDYLVVPRVAGITVAIMAVTIYFQFIAVIAGFAFTSLVYQSPFLTPLANVVSILSLYEVSVSLFKGLVFGMVISGISCLFGIRVARSITAVPRAATSAVMRNLMAIFFLDGLISYVAFF
jgi:phospholipid/cholesterol/gamma-HCH transport system permease protein